MDDSVITVVPRTLFPWDVKYCEASQSWMVTVDTDQKSSYNTRWEENTRAPLAFEAPTRNEAVCLARALSPPKMHPFYPDSNCFSCQTQLGEYCNATLCTNCGVWLRNSCVAPWPSKMLPTTYNVKNIDMLNICNTCDWLCSAFRLALLDGDYDKAISLHATGNVNLTTPFANIKGEVFYPVHCAVLGRSLTLLKWLVEDNCCPLMSMRVGIGGRKGRSESYTPILTSNLRSPLGIALSNNSIDIIRYLVVEKDMLLHKERNISTGSLLKNMDLILKLLPEDIYTP